jgi:hypothetical protein
MKRQTKSRKWKDRRRQCRCSILGLTKDLGGQCGRTVKWLVPRMWFEAVSCIGTEDSLLSVGFELLRLGKEAGSRHVSSLEHNYTLAYGTKNAVMEQALSVHVPIQGQVS